MYIDNLCRGDQKSRIQRSRQSSNQKNSTRDVGLGLVRTRTVSSPTPRDTHPTPGCSFSLAGLEQPLQRQARTGIDTTMTSFARLVEALMTPSLPVLILGLLIVIGAPVLLHLLVVSSSAAYTVPPSVVLVGPDGAGKTALTTLLERGSLGRGSIQGAAKTHTSQTCHAVELNASTDSSSRRSFRNHDDASGTHTKFLLVDTPGHPKLRNAAMGSLGRERRLRAIVFLVDAAALAEQDALAPTAAYLYDLLLFLQRRAAAAAKPSARIAVPVLIAANKMDLFTALPAAGVRSRLESEMSGIRASRSKGLLDSGVGMDDVGTEDAWLGEFGSGDFSFEQMREFDIDVDVIGGSVMGHGAEGPDVDGWWWWMAQRVS
ncbi:hypothetical protein XA68_17956 [Ophiocordyceps unilateralis]|uniref:Signal recognition particle receptor subunit beta n=1 Tax=Ophiocordyceps unilateralis TaxID=268505 RepID=A0A2A9P352_OPHUN|nr:hypothetical protein XA68_17956 [Ophiocordyceps unilateralis]